jgi:hypothetical protein
MGSPLPVIATADPKIEGNWMSSRIVRRLDLEYQRDEILQDVPTFDGQCFKQTRKFVLLTCRIPSRNPPCLHRFYIVEHLPYDVLLGSDKLGSTSCKIASCNNQILDAADCR